MPERLLVIAAKTPEPGRVKTRLLDGGISPETAADLARAFLTDTLEAARHPALRADCWLALDGSPEMLPESLRGVHCLPQRGNDLGERLTAIFAEGFSAGYRSVCVIGADMPHLPTAFMQEAFGRLALDAEIVLGPAADGGYYLVGLREPMLALFTQIPWSTDTVLKRTLQVAEQAGRKVRLLPTGYDVDTFKDVQRIHRDLKRGVVRATATEAALDQLAARGQDSLPDIRTER